jgi:signal transduction histidine kinase
MELTREQLDYIIRYNPGDICIYEISNGTRLDTFYYSKGIPAISGYNDEEYNDIISGDANKIVLENDIERVKAHIVELFCHDEDYIADVFYRIRHKTRSFVWIRAKARLLGTYNGAAMVMVDFINSSRESDGYSDIIDKSGNLIYVCDKDTLELYFVNSSAVEFWGCQDYTGRNCYEVIQGRSGQCDICPLRKMDDGSEHRDVVYDEARKKYFRVDCRRISWYGREATAIIATDITESEMAKKNFEQELTNSGNYADLVARGHFDLSEDKVLDYQMMRPEALDVTKFNTYSGVMGFIIANPTDRTGGQRLRAKMNRQALIKSFLDGNSSVEVEYTRMFAGKAPTWFKTVVNLNRSTVTGNVDAYLYTYNITSTALQGQIMNKLANMEYDIIGIIDLVNRTYFYYNVDAADRAHPEPKDYETTLSDRLYDVLPEQKATVMAAMNLEVIKAALDRDGSYSLRYGAVDAADSLIQREVRYAYLDETKDMLLFCRSDITVQYQAEQQLMKQMHEAVTAAAAANEAKSSFLSSMSHDMRTPLNGIIGFTRLALNESDPVKRQDYLEKIKKSGDLMLNLVNDTLELSRIESGKIQLELRMVNCSMMMDELLASAQAFAESKGVNVEADYKIIDKCYANIDRIKLEKVILNLLSNAIKFTKKDGLVTLTIEKIDPPLNGCNMRIIVADTGIGISPDFISRLYEPFAQEAHLESRGYGTGLGLTIVKKTVEIMKGSIDVESQVGKGSRFIVDLPIEIVSHRQIRRASHRTIIPASPENMCCSAKTIT